MNIVQTVLFLLIYLCSILDHFGVGMANIRYKKTLLYKVVLLYFFFNIISISFFTFVIANNQAELVVENTRGQATDLMESLLGTLQKSVQKGPSLAVTDSASTLATLQEVLKGLPHKYLILQEDSLVLASSPGFTSIPSDFRAGALKAATSREFSGKSWYLQVKQWDRVIRFFVPLDEFGLQKTTLFIEMDMDKIGTSVRNLVRLVIFTVIILSVLHFFFGFLVFRIVVSPIQRLFFATHRLAEGDWSHKVAFKRDDEFGALGDSFDNMVATIQTNIAELQNRMDALALAHGRIQQMAITDELTGLHNRRHLFERMTESLATSIRYRYPLGLILIDIDHFKKVNDVLGHSAGDQVLRDVAAELRKHTRASDILARYGGEELVVLLPASQLADAVQAAEKYRRAIESMVTILSDGREVRVTISLGVTEYLVASSGAGGDLTLEAFINVADVGLYQSKKNGRNQVTSNQ
jgi:diguanylate cyclase (GGDEF)-like protein